MYQRVSTIVVTDLDDEVVLLNPSNQQMFTLNDTGREVWLNLEQRPSVAELAEHITNLYEVEQAVAERDVQMILAHLLEHNLIEATSPAVES